MAKKTKALYMHLINSSPAYFEPQSIGGQIVYADKIEKKYLCVSLRQIRREQRISTANRWVLNYEIPSYRYMRIYV